MRRYLPRPGRNGRAAAPPRAGDGRASFDSTVSDRAASRPAHDEVDLAAERSVAVRGLGAGGPSRLTLRGMVECGKPAAFDVPSSRDSMDNYPLEAVRRPLELFNLRARCTSSLRLP